MLITANVEANNLQADLTHLERYDRLVRPFALFINPDNAGAITEDIKAHYKVFVTPAVRAGVAIIMQRKDIEEPVTVLPYTGEDDK